MALRSVIRAAKIAATSSRASPRISTIPTPWHRRHGFSTASSTSRGRWRPPPRVPPPMPPVVVNGRQCYDYDLCDAHTMCPSIPSMVAFHGDRIHESPPDQFATALAQFALDSYNAKQNMSLELLRVIYTDPKKEQRHLCYTFLEKAEYDDRPKSAIGVFPLSDFLPTSKDDDYVKVLPKGFLHDRDIDGFMYHITLETVDSMARNTFIAKLWVEQSGNMLQMEQMMPISTGQEKETHCNAISHI